MIASVTSTGTSTAPARELTRARPPSARPSRAASSGWTCSVQRSLPFTSSGEVVHPRVVRAQLAAADQHQAAVARGASSAAAQPRRRRRRSARGASSILPARRAQHLGEARLERPEVDAVRVASSVASVRPSGRRRSRRRRARCAASGRAARSGPRRGSSAASSSSASRPSSGERGVAPRATSSRRRSRRARRRRRRRPARRRSPASRSSVSPLVGHRPVERSSTGGE